MNGSGHSQAMDSIKASVDCFVSGAIRLRTSFIEKEKVIRGAVGAVSAAPLTDEIAGAIASYFSTIETELGLVALKVEAQCESNVALVEGLAMGLAGSQGRFARRQIERMREQLKAVMADVARLRHALGSAREQLLAPDSPASDDADLVTFNLVGCTEPLVLRRNRASDPTQ